MRHRDTAVWPYMLVIALVLIWMFFAVEPSWTVLLAVGVAASCYATGFHQGYRS